MIGLAHQEARRAEMHDRAVEHQIEAAEHQQPDRQHPALVPPQHRRRDRQRAQRPQIGRGHRVAAQHVGRIALADGPAHQPAVDQAVQMRGIGQPDRAASHHATAVHGEQRLEDRIGAQQQREDRRDLRIAVHQQDAELGHPEAQEIGTTIAQEDQAQRIVPDEEAHHPTQPDQRGHHDHLVADLEGNIGQRREHDRHAHRGQPVEAVDDVDRVGHAGHRQQRQRHREAGDQHQAVDAGNAGARDDRVGQPDRQRRRRDGGEQTLLRGHALGEVLDQAGAEGHQAAADQHRQQRPLGHAPPDRQQRADQHTHQDANAADPRHDARVEFLRLVLVGVAGQMRVMRRRAHHQQRHDEGGQK